MNKLKVTIVGALAVVGAWCAQAEEKCTDCITFSADKSFGIRLNKGTDTATPTVALQYSTDQLNWQTFNVDTDYAAEPDGETYKLHIRGTGNSKFAAGTLTKKAHCFTNTVGSAATAIACSGNALTLLDYETVAKGAEPTMNDYAFAFLFRGFAALTSAPALPATTLAEKCYYSMFYGCASLTAAPSLNATALANNCYDSMFSRCTSLTAAPALPATTMKSTCYGYMFQNCTALTAAPSLNATALANSCYDSMFRGCTSLKTAPSLNATELAQKCYNSMFRDCTSLVVNKAAPGKEWKIAATPGTGVTSWGSNMFAGTGGTLQGTPELNTTYYIASAPATVVPQAVANTTSYKVYTNDTVLVSENASGVVRWGAEVTVTYTAAEGYEFAGGAATWTTNVTANAATVAVAIPASEQPVLKPVEFTIADVANATKEVEGATLVEGTTYKALPGASVTVTYTADFGYFFADGAKTSVVETTAEKGATITTETACVVAAARIGTDKDFFTFEAAFDAAQDGDTVTLLKSVEIAAPISIAKKVGLDIGIYNVTPSASFAGGDGLFFVNYGGDFDVHGSTGTIDASSNAKIYEAIKLTVTGETYAGARAKLTVNANIKGYYYGITGNSSRPGTDIIVNGGTITAVAENDNLAIFNPQCDSTVTINGGTLTGYLSAIEMRGGTLTVNNGTLIATADEYAVAASGSGTTTKGAAVAIAQHTTKGDITVTIENATLTGVKSVSVANPQGNTTSNVEVTLADANYNGALAFSADGNATVTNDGAQITAPEGYAWNKEGVLAKAAVKIGTTYYVTLQDAFDAVKEGETVTLLADVADAQAKFDNAVAATLDLNGKTFCCATPKDPNNWYGFTMRVYKGTLTIEDSVGGGKVVNSNDDSALRCCAAGDDFTSEPKVIVNGGTFENSSKSESTVYAGAQTAQHGTIVINDATVLNTYDGAFDFGNASRILNVGNGNPAGGTAISVTGGTYQVDPALGDDHFGVSYVAAGYASYEDGDVWKIGEAAAKIGTTYYLTLQDAFDAVEAGQTIELLADAELGATISVDKAVTLDIGTFDVTPKATFSGNALFALAYGGDFTVNGTTGTVDASTLSTVYAAIKMPTTGAGSATNRAKLTVDANLTGNYYAIVGNGKYGYTDIVVNGGTITAAVEGNNQAIFNPQGNSTVTVNDGTLTGHNSAIEMRGGTLTVNGGTLTSTATSYSVVKNKSGSTTVGAAVAVAQYASAGDLAVDVKGGTITGFKSVSVANPQGNKTSNVTVTLGAADYTGDLAFSADGNATVTDNGSGLAAPAGYGWKNGVLTKCTDIDIGGGMTAKDFGNGDIEIAGSGELADISALAGTAITNLTIGAGVTGIADNLFATRRDLRDVTIGADCATVGASSFGKCRNVTNIVVKGSVTVGDYAFLRCNSLQTITFEGLAEFNKTPFALHTAIYMKDGMPEVYAVPEVKINGYKQVLMGTNDLADPTSWTAITDEEEKADYHFFKIEMKSDE